MIDTTLKEGDLLDRKAVCARVRAWFSQPEAQFAWDRTLGRCVYRGNDDPASTLRCSIGCLIPDDQYSSDLEGTAASVVLSDSALRDFFTPEVFAARSRSCTPVGAIPWVNVLQQIHDDMAEFGSGKTVADFLTALDVFEEETT